MQFGYVGHLEVNVGLPLFLLCVGRARMVSCVYSRNPRWAAGSGMEVREDLLCVVSPEANHRAVSTNERSVSSHHRCAIGGGLFVSL